MYTTTHSLDNCNISTVLHAIIDYDYISLMRGSSKLKKKVQTGTMLLQSLQGVFQ